FPHVDFISYHRFFVARIMPRAKVMPIKIWCLWPIVPQQWAAKQRLLFEASANRVNNRRVKRRIIDFIHWLSPITSDSSGRFRRGRLWPTVVPMLLAALPTRAVIHDFSGPVPNVTASYSSGVVTLAAFDPAVGLRTAMVNSAGTFDLTTSDGVAAWSGGNIIYYYIYYSAFSNWIFEGIGTGLTLDLLLVY